MKNLRNLLLGRKDLKAPTHFGKAQIVTKKELDESSYGISLCLPEEPDYDTLRIRQLANAEKYEAFHASGAGIFAEEAAAVLDGHLAQIEEAYCRYLEALTTTYAAQLSTMKLEALGEAAAIQDPE